MMGIMDGDCLSVPHLPLSESCVQGQISSVGDILYCGLSMF